MPEIVKVVPYDRRKFMGCKTLIVDENRMESHRYQEGELPVLRLKNSLDDYQKGEIACHWHSEFQFGLLLKGELKYYLLQDPASRLQRIIKPGDGFFINSRVFHGCRQMMRGTEIFTFGMLPGFFINPVFGNIYQKIVLPVLHSHVTGFFLFQEKKEDAGMLDLYRKFHKLNQKDRDFELSSLELICGIWKELLHRIHRQTDFASNCNFDFTQAFRIQKMLEFIQKHYPEPITVNQIAEAGGISRRECFRCFRAVINQAPTEYLNQYRLTMAAQLLTVGGQSLARVSESCGFENFSYFCRLFKKKYHMSPGQFRNGDVKVN